MYQPPPLPKKSRTGLVVVIVVVIVVIILMAVAAALLLTRPKLGVDVNGVKWSGSNPCAGLSGQTTPGFVGPDGGTLSYSLGVSNPSPILGCTINSISATTSGFSVSGGNLPLTISAGGSATLAFTIDLPGSDFSGVLDLVVS
jgi:hypothetical protein